MNDASQGGQRQRGRAARTFGWKRRGTTAAEPATESVAGTAPTAGGRAPVRDPEADTCFRWKHLIIRRLLGGGRFGEVFLAHDPWLDRTVALKLLRHGGPVSAREALREGRMLARVRHPNVVAAYGADEDLGRIGIWTEYVEGETLEQVRLRAGSLSEHEVGAIGLALCGALSAAHAKGVLHRDLKLTNVMRERTGRIVLVDFGLGIEIDRALEEPKVSGTPPYLAPELFAGGQPSRRSDLYSLGVLLFRLASGAYPIAGQTVAELREAHHQRRYTPLRDLRPDWSTPMVAVVDRCLEPDPERRFRSAGEVEAALHQALGRWPTRWPRSAVVATVGILAAVVVGLSVALTVLQRGAPPAPSEPRTIALAAIQNRTSDAELDDVVAELLRFVAGEADLRLADWSLSDPRAGVAQARRRAARAGLGGVLSGVVEGEGERMRLRLTFAGPAAGAPTVRGEASLGGDGLARGVDRAWRSLLEQMPIGSLPRPRAALEDVTTSSLEALKRYSRALALHRDGAVDAAIRLLETTVEVDPAFAMAWNRLADYQSGAGMDRAAVASSARAFALRDRASDRERRHLAAIYYRIRLQHELAAAELERLAALGPSGLADVGHQLAFLYEWLGDYERAIAAARAGGGGASPDVIHRGALALMLADAGLVDEALAEVQAVRSELGDHLYLHWPEGLALQVAGRLPEAEAAFTAMADATEPVYQRFGHLLRAQVLVERGATARARGDLEVVATLARQAADDNAAFWAELWTARLLAADPGNPQAAGLLSELAAGLDPENPRTIERGRAVVLALLDHGQEREAQAGARVVAALAEQYPSLYARAAALQVEAELLVRGGEPARARRAVLESLRQRRDVSALLTAARVARANGESAAARNYLAEAAARKGAVLRLGFVLDWLAAQEGLGRSGGREVLP